MMQDENTENSQSGHDEKIIDLMPILAEQERAERARLYAGIAELAAHLRAPASKCCSESDRRPVSDLKSASLPSDFLTEHS